MRKNQKGSANVILIAIIVALSGLVIYFAFVKESEPVAQQSTPTPVATPTPTKTPIRMSVSPLPVPTVKDETASWKTYTSGLYSFNLKYPTSWDSGQMTSFELPFYLTKGDSSIKIFPTGGSDYGTPWNAPTVKNIKIDGRDAVWTEWSLEKNRLLVHINLKTYPKYWNASNRIDIHIAEAELAMTNQILSTFKFTN